MSETWTQCRPIKIYSLLSDLHSISPQFKRHPFGLLVRRPTKSAKSSRARACKGDRPAANCTNIGFYKICPDRRNFA